MSKKRRWKPLRVSTSKNVLRSSDPPRTGSRRSSPCGSGRCPGRYRGPHWPEVSTPFLPRVHRRPCAGRRRRSRASSPRAPGTRARGRGARRRARAGTGPARAPARTRTQATAGAGRWRRSAPVRPTRRRFGLVGHPPKVLAAAALDADGVEPCLRLASHARMRASSACSPAWR